MTYTFSGVTISNEDRTLQGLYWARADLGVTVMRVGGVWKTVMGASQDVLDTGDRVYRGGYGYTLTDDLAAELIAAGFENYLQIVTVGPELLPNPSFDDSPDLTGWVGFFVTINLDTTQHQTGRASMRCDLAAGGVFAVKTAAVIPVTPGATYALSGWVRSTIPLTASPSAEGADLWAIFGPTAVDADYFQGAAVNDSTITNLSTTTSWAQHTAKITAPVGCNFVRISPRAYTAGSGNSVYWDNLSFKLAA